MSWGWSVALSDDRGNALSDNRGNALSDNRGVALSDDRGGLDDSSSLLDDNWLNDGWLGLGGSDKSVVLVELSFEFGSQWNVAWVWDGVVDVLDGSAVQ